MSTNRLLFFAVAGLLAIAEDRAEAQVHRCVGADGKVTLSQVKCRADLAPAPAEIASAAERVRMADIEKERKRAAERADEQLVGRFADEASLRKAFVAEIEAVAVKIRLTTGRLDALIAARRPIDEERKFYVDKPLTPSLQRRLDENESQFEALATVYGELRTEIAEIIAKYDRWRDRLLKLLAGEKPGSLGLLDVPAPPLR